MEQQTIFRNNYILDNIPIEEGVFPADLPVICNYASKAHSILEIGTFEGRTTINMALHSPKDATILSLDIVERTKEHLLQYPELLKKIRFINADSTKSTIETFRTGTGAPPFDLIFVDGNHDYEHVLCDTRLALMLIKPSGVIMWHDYTNPPCPGVKQALDWYKIPIKQMGSFLAVLELENLKRDI